ncbi:glycoside hydrolase family 19 protein [Pseudomonas sp. GV071]|uniref:glycoside hydrolase family 19 protein n=1 Tax=Pseudomonas sp. GV071 TaxID=2135754 RepID=UPI000D3690B0|nr:glycoside hydrolase family 19 protein [Pseudomonas sp. GV071]PTQ70280.1 putative chitinase [Pseudomonas sp. GV071]
MQITLQQLLQILPNARPVAGDFVSALNTAMARFRIDSSLRCAAFLAQVGHESAQLTRLVENLNYSAQGLASTWPGRFAGIGGVPNQQAQQLARNPQAIANRVYSERLGNGPESSGDGWRYRGRGLIQITGRDNYRLAGQALMADLEAIPPLLERPLYGALSAGWFWQSQGLNELADGGKFDAITHRINGGTTGQKERQKVWEVARQVVL